MRGFDYMSASSKKKLRNAEEAAKLTERQRSEQKEARKLTIYTVTFVVALALSIVVALTAGISRTVINSGFREKHTVALTIGDTKLTNAQLNYYYIDCVNDFYSSYGSYALLFGLDLTQPLNEQVTDTEAGTTWADDFTEAAISNAVATYALVNAANAAGYTATEEELEQVDTTLSTYALYAVIYGYSSTEDYLKAIYGNGATEEGFREYCEMNILASSYYTYYNESLTYEDADLRELESENYNAYSSYTYNSYYLAVSSFLEGGTTDEDGNTTYSEEEQAAALAAAEAAAASLTTNEDIQSAEDFDAAIAALSINADSETEVSSTAYTDTKYASLVSLHSDWVTDSSRQAGDMTYIASTSTSTDEDGNETTTTSGYYVLYFQSMSDNDYPLANVRHILVEYEGGTTDDDGNTTYSEEEKAAALATAEEILAEWEAGEATEETFAALAVKNSADTGSAEDGGLYENVYPGQMVANFNDWCFAEGRQAGDTGIVESDYGYHIMYYVGDSDITYRDYMIESDLRATDTAEWYSALVEETAYTVGNTRYLRLDLVLSGRYLANGQG